MFQRGTGERFKYKQAVKAKFPTAVCKRTAIKIGGVDTIHSRYLYAIELNNQRISEAENTAEAAWADAWIKHCKNKS